MEILDNFLIDLIKDIPKTDLTNFFGLFKKVKIKKNEVYFREGKQHFKIFYIKKGLLRGFYTDSKGSCCILQQLPFLFRNMSKKSLEILEDKSKSILTQVWKTVL